MSSRIALGTVQFGMPYGIANSVGQVDITEARAMLDFASSVGIDTLDTAAVYGSAETLLGGIGVDGFRVVTKVPGLDGAIGSPGPRLQAQVEASIQRLKLDRLYGLLLHQPDDLLGSHGPELARQMVALRSAGLVEKIGVSIYRPDQLGPLLDCLPIDLVQAPMNVFDHRLERSGWLKRLVDIGIELHVRSVFLQGLLLMPLDEVPPRFDPWRDRLQTWHRWLARDQRDSLTACLQHVNSKSGIGRIVVGCDSLLHLQQIAAAIALPSISAPLEFFCENEKLINPATWIKS